MRLGLAAERRPTQSAGAKLLSEHLEKCMPKTLQERFEEKTLLIPESTCHWWTGCVDKDGYGRIRSGSGNDIRANRVMYKLVNGQIPEGLVVRHTCNQPLCINPVHLILGTNKQNSEDMVRADNHSTGERNGSVKLTESQVLKIRRLSESMSLEDISKMFPVSATSIGRIVKRENWKHI